MQISEFANKNQESDVKLFDGLDELTKFIKENFNEYKVDKSMKKKKKKNSRCEKLSQRSKRKIKRCK